jgi:hypothetical protein
MRRCSGCRAVEVKVIVQEVCDAAKEGDEMIDVLDPQTVITIQAMVSKPGWLRQTWKEQKTPTSENEVLLV